MSPAPRSRFPARRGIAATVVVALVLAVLALVTPSPASAATVAAVGSAGQIYVTGLDSGAQVQLFQNGQDKTTTLMGRTWYPGQQPNGVAGHVATLVADTAEAVTGQGHALVIREVPPGDYEVHVGADVSNTITVTGDTPDPTPAGQNSTPADTTYQSTQLSCPTTPAVDSQCYTYIPTRDGTLLSANIVFPKTAMPAGGWPVLVDYSGYDPSQPGQTPQEAAMFPYQGYVIVGLNMRGTTCSGGRVRLLRGPAEPGRLRRHRGAGPPALGGPRGRRRGPHRADGRSSQRPGREQPDRQGQDRDGRHLVHGDQPAVRGPDPAAGPAGHHPAVDHRRHLPLDAAARRHLQQRLRPELGPGADGLGPTRRPPVGEGPHLRR